MDRSREQSTSPRFGGVLACLLALAAGLPATSAWAEDDPPIPLSRGARTDKTAPAPKPAPEPVLAVIRGSRVNVRVGPRVDTRPVMQLDQGAVLLIIERVPGWVGVQIPRGFPAAVSSRYVQFMGEEAVRITARRLNLRAHPPAEGSPMPGAFREQAPHGAVLPLIERDGDWVWVLVPPSTRAYVSTKFVRELGPASKHAELLGAARRRRTERVHKLAEERRERAARISGRKLREAIGAAQQSLYRLRIEGGIERVPVIRAVNRLEAAIEASAIAPSSVRKIAYVLRQDLEAELAVRMARRDAEVSRLRGLRPPPEKPPAPPAPAIVVRGGIRWESAPTWRNGGAFVLWSGGEPTHVLRLTTGLPHPVPDLKKHAGKGVRVVEGRMPGDRVFGLPVIEVRSIK